MDKKQLEEGTQPAIQFDKRGGLVPVVVQDFSSGKILMLGYANQTAFEQTVATGYATFFSTSRQELWVKGATSGDLLKIERVLTDCDQDALIYQVKPLGQGACHTKNKQGATRESCFYREVESDSLKMLEE